MSGPSWRAWLLDARRRPRRGQARLGQLYWRAWLPFRAQPAGAARPVHRRPAAGGGGPRPAARDRIRPIAQDLAQRLLPPSAARTGSAPTSSAATSGAAHRLGRADHALPSCCWSAVTVGPVGLSIGTVAGYCGGWIDAVLMRITDIFLAFPRLILALAFVAALGPGHRERDHRHRAHRLAALRPAGARRDADDPQQRLHRGREAAGRLAARASCSPTSRRCACPR